MKKIIWSLWFQSRDEAPQIVRKCLDSWEYQNPTWEFRCLDANSIERYISIKDYIDLDQQEITAASLSDIVRILLLHEYGGVWVDATLFCNQALDTWLPELMTAGFFAFSVPAQNRLLSSWFLASEPNNLIVTRWCAQAIRYWKNRTHSDDYFWFHHQFNELCETDETVHRNWIRVPKLGANKPHAIQFTIGMYRLQSETIDLVDWTTPVFKLTYRIDQEKYTSSCLLHYLLDRNYEKKVPEEPIEDKSEHGLPMIFAGLKVSTENLGDHIQIIAGEHLLTRHGVKPSFYIDRDTNLATSERVNKAKGQVAILMNGWFKRNSEEWPPHPKLTPLFLGFHIRLFQCPELISDASIDYYRQYQPIGCRDSYTETLLRSKGIETFLSNCLSLTLPRRLEELQYQKEIFVVSRDKQLLKFLPSDLGQYTYISHYSGSTNFEDNMVEAQELLQTYHRRARLIITTLLHCALPAIAMGIPVIVLYPPNNEFGHNSDKERFSTLAKMIRIYQLNEIENVDWNPKIIDISDIKLGILDRFYEITKTWPIVVKQPLGPIAQSSALPPPVPAGGNNMNKHIEQG